VVDESYLFEAQSQPEFNQSSSRLQPDFKPIISIHKWAYFVT